MMRYIIAVRLRSDGCKSSLIFISALFAWARFGLGFEIFVPDRPNASSRPVFTRRIHYKCTLSIFKHLYFLITPIIKFKGKKCTFFQQTICIYIYDDIVCVLDHFGNLFIDILSCLKLKILLICRFVTFAEFFQSRWPPLKEKANPATKDQYCWIPHQRQPSQELGLDSIFYS